MLYVKPIEEFYYDVGLRGNQDATVNHELGNSGLSKTVYRWGKPVPRFLEDFVEVYGANNIRIKEYGTMSQYKSYINKVMEN